MRIVQVIDSLETGGAERMAVNYANALVGRIEFSGLVATRSEGGLRAQIDQGVNYLFLKKKHTLDFGAAMRLKNYCVLNKINYVHAHSTSYFIVVLVKLMWPKIRIIWHDHNGNSENLSKREYFPLNIASLLFSGIVVVNFQLKQWAQRKLHCKHLIYISNFTYLSKNLHRETHLFGVEGKRILMLANLREQKDHFMLSRVAKRMKASHPDWTFHLVGKDFDDEYSARVKAEISNLGLSDTVFFYGSRNDTDAIISQCDIAILTSNSEGLPVALLEYGMHSRPVVVTSVGQVPKIISDGENGMLVPSGQDDVFWKKLAALAGDKALRSELGNALNRSTSKDNSAEAAVSNYLNWLKTL